MPRRRAILSLLAGSVAVVALWAGAGWGDLPPGPRRAAASLVLWLATSALAWSIQRGSERSQRERGRILDAISLGDLAVAVPAQADPGGELARLLAALRRLIQGFDRTALGVQEGAGEIGQRSREVGASAWHQTQALERATQALEGAANARQALTRQLDQVAQADREHTDAVARLARISQAIEGLLTDLDQLAGPVSQAAKGAAEGMEELTSAAANLTTYVVGMDGPFGRSGEAAGALASVRDRVTETRVLAQAVGEAAEGSRRPLGEAVEGLRSVDGSLRRSQELMATLGDRSSQIGRIVEGVDEIADQTKLLALNAAILAAGAGGQGRAFAIVAQEIRGLAERTARSTHEIGALVTGVQADVKGASLLIAHSGEETRVGLVRALRAEEALTRIETTSSRTLAAIERVLEETARLSFEEERVAGTARSLTALAGTLGAVARTRLDGARSVHKGLQELVSSLGRIQNEVTLGHAASLDAERSLGQLSLAFEAANQSAQTLAAASLAGEATLRPAAAAILRSAAVADALAQASAGVLRGAQAHARELAHFRLPSPRRGGTASMAIALSGVWDDPRGFDPAQLLDAASLDLSHLIYEALVEAGDDMAVVPGLASAWESSDEGRLYRFHLAAGRRFHDETRATAEAVKRHFERRLRPPSGEAGDPATAAAFADLEGLLPFLTGDAREARGLRPVDAETLEIRFERPRPLFLRPLGLCRVGHVGADGRPIGTGPFRVEALHRRHGLTLARDPGGPLKGGPHLDRIDVRICNSQVELQRLLGEGSIDLVPRLDRVLAGDRSRADPRMVVASAELPEVQLLGFHCQTPPFNDPRVRRAVWAALDVPELLRTQAKGERAARSVVPEGLLGLSGLLPPQSPDVALAQRLLAEAGHSRLRLTLLSPADQPAWRRECEPLFRHFPEAGLDLAVEELPTRAFAEALRRGRAPFFRARWEGAYPDPDAFLFPLFHSREQRTLALGFSNAEVDGLTREARGNPDPAQRAACYQRLERIVREEAPLLPLYHGRQFVAYASRIQGVRLHPTLPILHPAELWIER